MYRTVLIAFETDIAKPAATNTASVGDTAATSLDNKSRGTRNRLDISRERSAVL